MALTLRSTKGIALTWAEMDDNFSGLADGSLWGTAVSAPGSLTVSGAVSTPAAATARFGAESANGAEIIGSGTTNDLTFYNKLGQEVFRNPTGTKNIEIVGSLNIGTIGAFVASDKYLVVDGSGNVHKSATGPAS